MKKLVLFFAFAFFSLCASAAQLNPFAYGLKSELDELSFTLKGEFYINAPATSVTVYAVDAQKNKYLLHSYGAVKAKGKISFEFDLMKLQLPTNTAYTWCVEVTGEAVTDVTFVSNSNKLYAPYSIDIDNNPENANFGTVFCTEGRPNGKGNSKYLSNVDGAGLYVLNADGTARKIPGYTNRYGYNGSRVNETQQYFISKSGTKYSAHSPYRVRVSDDGRIFITSLTPDGHVLWEANPVKFSDPDKAEWGSWRQVMSVANSNSNLQSTKKIISSTVCANHDYCNIGNLYTSGGDFIAGPNVGFDVKGSGKDLKLLMLSGCRQAIAIMTPPHFYCYEYDLGTATVWDKKASTHIFSGHSEKVDIVNYAGAQVQYDKDGNVWFCQHRGSADATTLAKINRSGNIVWQDNPKQPYRRCGGLRFKDDFSQLVVASNANPNTGDNSGGGFTIYPVGSDGTPIWAQGKQYKTYSNTGSSLMDFAWDYADNLYIAADKNNGGECIAIYAMPHAADKVVSTPAASKYAFTINCKEGQTYTVKATCAAAEGSVACVPVAYAGVVGNGMAVPSCTELTLTVTPDAAHKFLGWKDNATGSILSTDKVFTFSVTRDLTLTAIFEYAEYKNITWWNLFKDGQDVEVEGAAYNERLWRWYQVEFAEYRTKARGDKGVCSGQFLVSDFLSTSTEDNEKFLMSETNNSTTPFVWLRKYIEYLNGGPIVKKTYSAASRWQYILPMFFNCSNVAYSSTCDDGTYVAEWTGKKFSDYGKKAHWRPWWTEYACNLPGTMTYADNMPTMNTWKRVECSTGTIVGIAPSGWYQWNTPSNVPALKEVKDDIILAWRNGSPTGEIVHHVWQDDMKLHVSYVLRHIDENDPPADPTNPATPYDATNEDVIKLMQNPNWDPSEGIVATHNLTVTRKLVKGMYNTICLPFDVDVNGLMDTHHLKNATILEFTGVSSLYNDSGDPVTVLNFTEIQDEVIGNKTCRILQAGIPYLVKVNDAVLEETLAKDMLFTGIGRDVLTLNAHSSETISGVTFHGTINPTNIPAGSVILVADNRLATTTEDGELLGLRGYFTIDPMMASDIAEQAADGRVYLSINKPVTTSVPMAPEAEKPAAPKVKKIMRDGQIYIIRDGVTYTITGARVR